MLLFIALLLLFIWLGGFTLFFSAVGSIIHLVLVIAIILFVVHFLTSTGVL